MVKHMRQALLLLAMVVALAGCETADPVQRLPELTFAHLPPLALDVAAVEVVNQYHSPLKRPNVEHEFPTPPARAVERWAHDRLKAVGARNRARLVIRDAPVTEAKLKLTEGIKGAFTKDQSERYDALLDTTLEIVDDSGRVLGFAISRASRSRTVREDATLNERERTWHDIADGLMKDFNAEMERNIRQHLVNWLR